MRLPAGGFHQLFECGAVRPFQQCQDLRCFAAFAGAFASLGRLRALWLFSAILNFTGLLPRLALSLSGRNTGLPALNVAFLVGFASSAGATATGLASASMFGVFIVNAPLAVITAVRTSITRVWPGSKVILTALAMERRWWTRVPRLCQGASDERPRLEIRAEEGGGDCRPADSAQH